MIKKWQEQCRLASRLHGWLDYRFGPGDTCELLNIFVDWEWHDQGIGSALVAEVEQVAKGEGCKSIYGFTRATNDAVHRFYTRKGYGLISLPDFYGMGEHGIMVHKVIA